MNTFVTCWFTTIFVMVVCVGLKIEEQTAAIVAGLMMIGIMPMIAIHDWIERKIEAFRRSCQTRQRVGIYPFDDWK
jgi:hypothetical protein